MSPTRIVILTVLFYLLYRLLTANKKNASAPVSRDATGDGMDDVLMEDPVCHTFIPMKEAKTIERDGKTFYFCSAKCKNLFKKGAEE